VSVLSPIPRSPVPLFILFRPGQRASIALGVLRRDIPGHPQHLDRGEVREPHLGCGRPSRMGAGDRAVFRQVVRRARWPFIIAGLRQARPRLDRGRRREMIAATSWGLAGSSSIQGVSQHRRDARSLLVIGGWACDRTARLSRCSSTPVGRWSMVRRSDLSAMAHIELSRVSYAYDGNNGPVAGAQRGQLRRRRLGFLCIVGRSGLRQDHAPEHRGRLFKPTTARSASGRDRARARRRSRVVFQDFRSSSPGGPRTQRGIRTCRCGASRRPSRAGTRAPVPPGRSRSGSPAPTRTSCRRHAAARGHRARPRL